MATSKYLDPVGKPGAPPSRVPFRVLQASAGTSSRSRRLSTGTVQPIKKLWDRALFLRKSSGTEHFLTSSSGTEQKGAKSSGTEQKGETSSGTEQKSGKSSGTEQKSGQLRAAPRTVRSSSQQVHSASVARLGIAAPAVSMRLCLSATQIRGSPIISGT